ncbi:MAG: tetratricopeptide repeat protein [Planctomycetes bacterium]|nr:tetratricopeptide repeat protein [Planctomycetota bacterium]
MSAVNRNDPCPCGSGRKAKNCCHRAEVPAAKSSTVLLPALGGAPARRVPLAEAVGIACELQRRGQLAPAAQLFELVLAANGEHADALFFFGILRHQTGQSAEGLALMRRALEQAPGNRLYHYNFAIINAEIGDRAQAIASYRRSIEIEPNADACNNLAGLLLDEGCLDEAIACFRRGGELNPDDAVQQSNMLYALNYRPNPDLGKMFEEHKAFGERHERVIARMPPREAEHGPGERPLRIGYVSSDFRQHAVVHLVEPALESHDKSRFEIYCFYNYPKHDAVTRRIQSLVPHWREIAGRTDAEVARMIREDRIDILVDLSGHTPLHRLLVFARKPVPVQVSWIAYPNTTGLTAIDYRLTDDIRDPVGANDAFHTEKLVRLPRTVTCFRPLDHAPEVGPLPALTAGHVMFGSFNNFIKMHGGLLETWAGILRRVPGSRLTLKYRSFESPSIRAKVSEAFARGGVAPDRLVFLGSDDYHSHLKQYNSIDIALDTFPHNGDLTTCDALWMGVPVITFTGISHVARMGAGRLTAVGLAELVGRNREEYADIAVALAGDLPRLAALRGGLRQRMRASPLMDAKEFTRHLERAYRAMWETHLAGGTS